MSSNQYGFTCTIEWKGRSYEAQIVYVGTDSSNYWTLDEVTVDWSSHRPEDLARYELDREPDSPQRIDVWDKWGGYLPGDPSDPSWNPPKPSDREVFEIISRGDAANIHHGWDT